MITIHHISMCGMMIMRQRLLLKMAQSQVRCPVEPFVLSMSGWICIVTN